MRTQPLRSPRLLKKKRQRIIMRSVLGILGMSGIILLPVFLLRLAFWRVDTITIVGNAAVSEESIRQLAMQKLDGTYIHLYPKSNILLYPKKNIEQNILNQFSRISEVSIKTKSLHEIEVEVIEQKPIALWCANINSECYFLNADGYVFDVAPLFTDNVFIVYTGNIIEKPIGNYFAPADEFNRIHSLVTQISELNLAVDSVDALPDNDYALMLSTGETIFVTTRQKSDVTFSNLESVLSDPKLALRKNDGLSVLSIDLRFGNKVFYKQKAK
ncbi:FtsQ-type POTRA domain-containing protein [Patescibacteria group bacterium]|nr:FtsQ-type POTRA domain-containing protein [Patescibacteria group bacterium]